MFPPERAAALLLVTAAVSIVLAKPRFAYYLLPLTVPWGSAFPLSSTSQVTISDVVVAALVLHALLSFARTRQVTLSVTPWTISAMLLLLAMALSATQAMSLTLSAKEIIKWVELISVAVLAPAYLRPGRDIWIVVATTIAGGFTEALLGLYQFAFHVGPQNFEIYGRFLRAYGTFGQPNPLAGYLNIVLPIAVATAWVTRRASARRGRDGHRARVACHVLPCRLGGGGTRRRGCSRPPLSAIPAVARTRRTRRGRRRASSLVLVDSYVALSPAGECLWSDGNKLQPLHHIQLQ